MRTPEEQIFDLVHGCNRHPLSTQRQALAIVRDVRKAALEEAALVADAEHDDCERRRAIAIERGDRMLITINEDRGLVACSIADEIRALAQAGAAKETP